MRERRKLFSVTIKDCKVDTFRAGGKGGQNQNKVETGVRVRHLPSSAVGECRETRSQLENKRRAFKRMAESKAFQIWVKRKAAEVMGKPSPEEIVEEQMTLSNLKIEVRTDKGWVQEEVA